MQELCTLSAGYLPCFVFIFILHAFANHNEIILAYLLQRMSVKIFFLSRKMSQFHSCCFNFMWTQCLSIIYFSLLVNLRCLIYFRFELEIYFKEFFFKQTSFCKHFFLDSCHFTVTLFVCWMQNEIFSQAIWNEGFVVQFIFYFDCFLWQYNRNLVMWNVILLR